MPAPCTVTDVEPVPARLPRRVKLTPFASIDQTPVTLPTRPAVVITDRLDPLDPRPDRHLTDVSDSQSVASHPVCPTRPLTECVTTPSPAPCTVTDAPPVPARFVLRTTLSPPTSTDHVLVKLPRLSPTVITTRLDPPTPCPPWHLTDVSDSQLVDSQPVIPCRARTVYATRPKLPPCTVTAADPVPARFVRRVVLIPGASNDHVLLKLPAEDPAVITTRRLPMLPCPA